MSWKNIKNKAVSDELIRRGSLWHLMTEPQRRFFKHVEQSNDQFHALYCTRQLGKTTAGLIDAIGFCLKNKNVIVRIILPTYKQAREILFTKINELRDIIPKDVLPVIRKSEGAFQFKNGSVILLGGASSDNVEQNRGNICHRLILDEITCYDPSVYTYLLKAILYPQTTHTGGKIIAMGTPPNSAFHPFLIYDMPNLKAKGNAMIFTVYDNPLLTQLQIDRIIENYGSKDNLDFRREYLAELITAQDLKVIPEFDKAKHVFNCDFKDKLWDCSEFSREWQGIISCDLGVTDLTGIVGLIINTYTGKAVVCFERSMHGNTLGEFAEVYKTLYTEMTAYCSNIISICDCFEQSMITLRKDYKLEFQRPIKRSVEDNVAVARNIFARNKIEISTDCRYLIIQLENGIYDENKKVNKDFARSPIAELGHLDHLVSLMYALRKVNFGGISSKDLRIGQNIDKPKRKLYKEYET